MNDVDGCKGKRSETPEENPFLSMARDQHNYNMKIVKLKECEMVHLCTNMVMVCHLQMTSSKKER